MGHTSDLNILVERDINPDDLAVIRARFLPPTLTRSDEPTVYATAGIPGSGKSFYVDQCIACGGWPENAFILDPDRVMQALPSYKTDAEKFGYVTAFRLWELPARTLAYQMADEAAAAGFDIIQDMGSVRRENYDRLAGLKARGYRLYMTYVYCPVDVALDRIKHRPRHTPPEMFRERFASLNILLPDYVALADRFTVVDHSDLTQPFRPTTLDAVMSNK